jgi:arylformamidase
MTANAPSAAWRQLSEAAREQAYSPSSCIGGDYRPLIAAYAQRSQAARAQVPHQVCRYGAAPAQLLDYFPPAPTMQPQTAPAPLLVFIHGGYWQELSKDESAFAAAQAVQQGAAFAALNYTLAPQASVGQIVEECRLALAWLQAQAGRLGFDANRIVVAGSSAGAHLAAMVALADANATAAAVALKGVVLVSGVYELEPLVGTTINHALGLSPAQAVALSPALAPLKGFAPAVVCWGAVETEEFKRQGREFAAQLGAAGTACQSFEVPARNHFDVVLDLADPATRLGQAVAAMLFSQ